MALWPNSSHAVPVSSFVTPVAVPGVDPLTGDCVILRVNKAWLPYMIGAMQQLLLQTTWDTDAEGLSIVQGQASSLIFALNDLEPGDCGGPRENTAIAESEYLMSICEQLRWQDGKLQGLCCGEWVDIAGQGPSGPPPQAGQPGAGSGVPAPNGGQNDYCFTLGRGTRILPVPVNSGDTLLFSGLFGAWQDASDLFWHCPDGFLFVLDVCGPTTPHGSPDPVPGGYHMQLIADIGGTFYDILQTDDHGTPSVFTVPPGIVNQNVIIQANIDDVNRINGEVEFCVQVTNNAVGAWSSMLDFTTLTYGGFVIPQYGHYEVGRGYVGDPFGSDQSVVVLRINLPGTDLTRMLQIYDTPGQGGVHGIVAFETQTGFYGSAGTPGPQIGATWNVNLVQSGVTSIFADNNTGTTPGDAVISNWQIFGTGVKPSFLP